MILWIPGIGSSIGKITYFQANAEEKQITKVLHQKYIYNQVEPEALNISTLVKMLSEAHNYAITSTLFQG